MTQWRITDAQGVALLQILETSADERAKALRASLVDAIEDQARNSPADDDEEDGEEFEYCECGRDWNDCASQHGADYCADADEYIRRGSPKRWWGENDENEEEIDTDAKA